MTEEVNPAQRELLNTLDSTYGLNPIVLSVYARLWQLETWLRQLVYVELSAKYGDQWHTKLPGFNAKYVQNDKYLTHMATYEELPLSYVTFGSLTKAISQEWNLFQDFLPPKNIWEARIEEISQIRNRVAHFRNNHADDLQRVLQLLRDIDKGVWRFCVSINSALIHNAPSNDPNDPVISEFSNLIPYTTGFARSKSHEFAHLHSKVELSIEALKRPWVTQEPKSGLSGLEGWIYDTHIHSFNNWNINYKDLTSIIDSLSSQLIYTVFYTSRHHVRVLIPAVIGEDACKDVIAWILRAVAEALTPASMNDDDFTDLIENTPEYILDDMNPIAFLRSDMPCSIFSA